MDGTIIKTSLGSPVVFQAQSADVVTKSDTTVLELGSLYVGVGGDVVVTLLGGTDATFKNVADGTFLPILVTKVKAATTATDILILR